jgi:predicted RecA/RadA family phage recombinase
MPQAIFKSGGGRNVNYTAVGAKGEGEVVVQADLIGVSRRPLASGELGSLNLDGVYDAVKASGDSIDAGDDLYWDDSADTVTETATGNKYFGKATEAGASGTAVVEAVMLQSEDV